MPLSPRARNGGGKQGIEQVFTAVLGRFLKIFCNILPEVKFLRGEVLLVKFYQGDNIPLKS